MSVTYERPRQAVLNDELNRTIHQFATDHPAVTIGEIFRALEDAKTDACEVLEGVRA